CLRYLLNGFLQLGLNPLIGHRESHFATLAVILALGVLQHVARSVPNLVTEVTVSLYAAHIPFNVAACGSERQKGKAQSIGAVSIDAFRELPARLLLNTLRHLRLHEACGAFLHKAFKINTIDEV